MQVFLQDGDDIREAVLWAPDGYWYPIEDGLPCFLVGALRPRHSEFAARHALPVCEANATPTGTSQSVTTKTFSDKWRRFRRYGFEPAHKEFLFDWYCKKFGLADLAALKKFYAGRRRVLEVGPGSGFNTAFIAEAGASEVFALDISDAARTVYENTRDYPAVGVVQADLMAAPFDDESFDLIIADGVLHHTPDTRKAVEALFRKLSPGGTFFFYVYKQMGPVRAFTDRYIRERFTKLTPEECYAACEPLTELARELSRLGSKVTLTKPIEILGIPSGTHNVQRLIYYGIMKCFWNEAFDFETNNMVNFDWYHPHDAWQHTREEVEGWLRALTVENYVFNDANPNGLSVLLAKSAR